MSSLVCSMCYDDKPEKTINFLLNDLRATRYCSMLSFFMMPVN